MQYLRKVKDEVTAETGQWRLWEPSQDVPKAETVYMTEMQLQPENISELKRIKGNLEDVLENRKEGAMLNRSLTPPRNTRQRSKSVRGEQRGKGSAKGDAKGEREPQQPDKGKLMEARSKAGPPVGSGESSSYRAPSRTRQEVKEPLAGAPASWRLFELTASSYWRSYGYKMMKHEICDFPKTFTYYNQKLHFILADFVKDLYFDREDYAPILSVMYNGHLKYEMVTPYNQKWLPRASDGTPISEGKRVSLNPTVAWTEDRWIFCRRMSGDDLCQILFYKLATLVWRKNHLTPSADTRQPTKSACGDF